MKMEMAEPSTICNFRLTAESKAVIIRA